MAETKTRPQTQTGLRAIRAHFETAKRGLEESAEPPIVDPHEKRDGVGPGQWEGFPHDRLPPGCPVHVIGTDVNGTVYVRTARGLLRAVEKWDMPTLADLFAPDLNYLLWAWPGWGKKKVVDEDGNEKQVAFINRVERDKAMMAIINAASKRPLFDPSRQHRGRGGWADKHGQFIWHSGGWMWMSDRGKLTRTRPGEHDGFLYTRQADTIEPWDTPVTQEESPARRILEDLRSWNWERPYLDPVLCLGWLATSLMGGALKTRPVIFTTGGAGVGKTTLRELFRNVLDGAVFAVADTTAAGIYQKLKNDALMVLVDELENKPGSTKAQAVIDLARIAYSGDDMARGGQDHEGVTFKMYASFLFSAINPPPMTEADRSRMAILNLQRLDLDGAIGRKPNISIETDGRMLLRQVMDGWATFQSTGLQYWWDELQRQKLDSRAIDTYGTLLAAAEMLVGPQALEDIGLPVAEPGRLGQMIAEATRSERAERLDNWHKCVNHLLDGVIVSWRDGVQPTIGGTMEALAKAPYLPDALELSAAQQRLALVNLSARKAGDPGQGFCLAVPKDGGQLTRIFDGTDWQKGGWWQALKQAPKHIVIRDAPERRQNNMKINGKTVFTLLIDMKAFEAYVDGLDQPLTEDGP
jgi:hypothetical protein